MIKICLIPLSLLIAMALQACANTQAKIASNSNQNINAIVFDATEDFSVLNAGDVPFYKDNGNDALAIDARHHEYRNLFAKATRTFTGLSGKYNVTITTLTEEDGESIYRLLINDIVVGTYRNSHIGKGSANDLKAERHIWRGISLIKGDSIAIESIAHSNGEIPENGGTAWARGRWSQIKLSSTNAAVNKRPIFNKYADLIVSQFDFQPDADDVHAVAALGSMLVHPDMEGVNLFAVAGTVGHQGGKYINAKSLMKLAFGKENLAWTDANKNWQESVNLVRNKARAVLAQGGKIWVQEAGQSDFTRDWVAALIESGVHQSLIKNNVIVVQHSNWNEKKTTPEDLIYVKNKTSYQAINDGNKPKRVFDRKNRRGPFTPNYVEKGTKWLKSATSSNNTKAHARTLWQQAKDLIGKSGFNAKHSSITKGGVDFSDNVEIWWILNLGQPVVSVHAFWQRYVSDVQLDTINPPKGRIAVIADGNSPDPDDIGATPVIFGLLKQAGLADRLVHLSHSCDLDPFRNKGKHQIDQQNEARRQKILHHLSGESLKLFGPFNNLRNYYNCRVDQQGAINDLVDAINASTADNPLWIIEAGEPDLIGYALQKAAPNALKYVHVVSHHPANDNSGDYFEWQQILDFGVTEHQIGDQNVALQTPIFHWDWAKDHSHPGFGFIWEMLAYAEKDGIVPFQANKFDCSDAGMVYWWITGADQGGNNFATPNDIKNMLLQ